MHSKELFVVISTAVLCIEYRINTVFTTAKEKKLAGSINENRDQSDKRSGMRLHLDPQKSKAVHLREESQNRKF